jgi:hypothetical protein
MNWTQFRYKHGLHDGTDPAEYAYAVYQSIISFLDNPCGCGNIQEAEWRIDHLKELQDALK